MIWPNRRKRRTPATLTSGIFRCFGLTDAERVTLSFTLCHRELTAAGAFLGSLSLHADAEPYIFYRAALDHICQSFRSVHAGVEDSAFGFAFSDELNGCMRGGNRPAKSGLLVWPFMAMLVAFKLPGSEQHATICARREGATR